MDGREEGAQTLWTVGYNTWPAPVRAERMMGALVGRGVTRVIDVRLNPCGSDAEEGRRYGPKPWTLQPGTRGSSGSSARRGSPMTGSWNWAIPSDAIARWRSFAGIWTTPKGAGRCIAAWIGWPPPSGGRENEVALLCACADADRCHRTLIARALAERDFDGRLILREVQERPARLNRRWHRLPGWHENC